MLVCNNLSPPRPPNTLNLKEVAKACESRSITKLTNAINCRLTKCVHNVNRDIHEHLDRYATHNIIQLRATLHHGPRSKTMEDGIFPWSDFMVQLPWFDFLRNQFTKPLGPSLGLHPMWTKRNDRASTNECDDFLIYAPKI